MRKYRITMLALSLTFLQLTIYAQRLIKYEDLFVLLNAKQYEQAEPFLKRYLKQNEPNPNAYLFMGAIYQDKLANINDESLAMNYTDSAILYYSKAISKLSISHLNSNIEYYQAYTRKDLRTGKFGIQFEDILYDINRRINGLTNELLKSCRGNSNGINLQSTSNTSSQTFIKSTGKYYALVIGVAEYSNYKLNLVRPTIDAQKIKKVLTDFYNFDEENAILLLNPSREQILGELFNLRKKVTTNDNLLIFYAGHGMFDEDAEQGYWWPRDADSSKPSNWLSNSDIRDNLRSIKTAHTLLIADACFCGALFRMRGNSPVKDAPLDVVSLYKLPSRRAITSGTMTTVPDQSVFFDYLLTGLIKNTSKYLTSQMLFDSFRQGVINNTLQVPQDGIIAETGDEGGDFVFIRRD